MCWENYEQHSRPARRHWVRKLLLVSSSVGVNFFLVVDKLKPVKVEKTLDEYLASLSITPKPAPRVIAEPSNSVISTADIDVHTIFDESYQQTVKELSALIKDKLKMTHVK